MMLDGWKEDVRGTTSSQARVLICVLATLGLCLVSWGMLLDLRREAWRRAEASAHNLLAVVEQDLVHNIRVIDLSLQGAIEVIQRPEFDALPAGVKQLALFSPAANAANPGILVVFDREGRMIFDAAGLSPRSGPPVAEAEYFKFHRDSPDRGLFVSQPYVSRLIGEPVIGLSRRLSAPDGSFAGIVLGTLRVSHFRSLFATLPLGRGALVSLVRTDGTPLVREPPIAGLGERNLAGVAVFARRLEEGSGGYIGRSSLDGVERLYAFRRVPDLPIVLTVGLSAAEIYVGWWPKAIAISLIVLSLSGATISLLVTLRRELSRRIVAEAEARAANAELARIAQTDPLTGLGNRRQFDRSLEREWKTGLRANRRFSLLIIDVDHFKAFNDRYGHPEGDAALRAIARCIRDQVFRPGDTPCRIGGEEFAVLLPETAADGACTVAEKIRRSVLKLGIPHAGNVPTAVTVSIGTATSASPDETAAAVIERADAALYRSKTEGRNRTTQADDPQPALISRVA